MAAGESGGEMGGGERERERGRAATQLNDISSSHTSRAPHMRAHAISLLTDEEEQQKKKRMEL